MTIAIITFDERLRTTLFSLKRGWQAAQSRTDSADTARVRPASVGVYGARDTL